MPSFDIVSKVDMQEAQNALESVRREIDQRYDFKGSNAEIKKENNELTVIADDNYKLEQIQDMLKVHFLRRKIDPKSLDFQKVENAFSNNLRQKVIIKEGIDADIAKEIIKKIKSEKLKVQASVRGEEVRVEGKKRDDLQNVMTMVKGMNLDLAVQFINFRD